MSEPGYSRDPERPWEYIAALRQRGIVYDSTRNEWTVLGTHPVKGLKKALEQFEACVRKDQDDARTEHIAALSRRLEAATAAVAYAESMRLAQQDRADSFADDFRALLEASNADDEAGVAKVLARIRAAVERHEQEQTDE